MGVASINYARVYNMASSIFNQFPSLPSPGAVTVCENNGRFVYAAEDDERINRDMQVTAIFSHCIEGSCLLKLYINYIYIYIYIYIYTVPYLMYSHIL